MTFGLNTIILDVITFFRREFLCRTAGSVHVIAANVTDPDE